MNEPIKENFSYSPEAEALQSREPGQILFLDDEEDIRISTLQAFDLEGFDLTCIEKPEEALERIGSGFDGVLISDIRMPGLDGISLLEKVLDVDSEIPVILVTGHGDVQLAVDAMRRGAYDFLEKPFNAQHLIEVTRKALQKRSLTLEVRELRSNQPHGDQLEIMLPGRSQIMYQTRKLIRTAANFSMDVLIIGETGTGKDLVARAIHSLSERANSPFVSINCGAIPSEHFESELFGHEVGAFAGALRTRYGKLEHGRGGTVFLDEIESMPLELQVRLLQVLQDRAIYRLGSNEAIELDVRFIAASKIDLEEAAKEGDFRKDLLFRLNAMTLPLPSLAERPDDIGLLFTDLVRQACQRYGLQPVPITAQVLAKLSERSFPGNVRELKNIAERFALGLGLGLLEKPDKDNSAMGTLAEQMALHERKIISAQLEAHNGVLKPVYESLNISRKSLYEKMQRHGLSRGKFVK